MSAPKRGLGKGLSALLQDVAEDYKEISGTRPKTTVSPQSLVANRFQPRKEFDEEALRELADSIRENGIIQPLAVRKNPDIDGEFEIIAGERRWRAAILAGLEEVPVIILDFNDQEASQAALIENIQRKNLNPIEEAEAFQALIDQFNLTQDELSKQIGKSRSHIANALRLLKLPTNVIDMVRSGKLSAGHARSLIGKEDSEELATKIVEEGLNVREAEQLRTDSGTEKSHSKDQDIKEIERGLGRILGMKVNIQHKHKSGSIRLNYDSLEQMDSFVQRIYGSVKS